MKTERQKLTDKLDKLWSLKVREKCQCEWCDRIGDIKTFDAHHLRGRGSYSTRWDLDNGVCLCSGCHRFRVHMDTLIASQLVEKLKKKRGKAWYPNLVKKSNRVIKFTIQDLRDLLEKYDGN